MNGTIVECNTAYGGRRSDTADHLKAAEEHGFTAIADVDIMDSEGEMRTSMIMRMNKRKKIKKYLGEKIIVKLLICNKDKK